MLVVVSDNPFDLLKMKKTGNSIVKKFEGAVRESWPLPPASVFKCRAATPWINPDLFYSGIIIVGDALPEEDENFDCDDDIYAELEHHSVESNRLSTRIVEYSENPERGIDPGNDRTQKGRSKLNPIEEQVQQSIMHNNAGSSREGNNSKEANVMVHNHERDFDGNVLIRFKEVPEFQGSGTSIGSNQGKKKRKWTPFKKDQSQSHKLFY